MTRLRRLLNRGHRTTLLSPRARTALGGVAVGAGMALVLIAGPLLVVGGGEQEPGPPGVPLAALSTLPDEPGRFDISSIITGEWTGEVCPDEGSSVSVHVEFDQVGQLIPGSIALDGVPAGVAGQCEIDGESIAFHEFLAILSDCDEACGVDRVYEGRFEDGALVGRYHDVAEGDECLSCLGGGSWWLVPDEAQANGISRP